MKINHEDTVMASAILHRVLSLVLLVLTMWFPLVSSASPPITPGNFHYLVYSDSTAELFWNRTTNVPVKGYEITRNGENLGVYDALSYLDVTLVPGTGYTYTIAAVGADGDRSGLSTVVLRSPPYADTIASLQRQISALENEIFTLESQINDGIRSPVPQTGQSVSMQPGDDGDLQTGVVWPDPRFTVNVIEAEDMNDNKMCDGSEICNGTVTDNLTGLVWLQNANCFGTGNWYDAIYNANGLTGDGTSDCGLNDNSQFGDWRLPNVKEIQSLMDYGHAFPTLLLPANHPFTDVQVVGIDEFPSSYWTSTSTGSSSDGVYSVSMSVGWVDRLSIDGTDFSLFVWPVRDRQ